ncbi:MAG TPA: biotin/lipoyl-containing protein [Candidatus Acidoferrum sp.]|nr:biotin/lipoyl-containing protein [Candidatus Acidoferrum sp.]
MKLTNEDVQQILQLLDAAKYEEFHLETEQFKLTLRRSPETGAWTRETEVTSSPKIIPNSFLSDATEGQAAANREPASQHTASESKHWAEVRAHLPGTFYRAPQPGALPFVEIGTSVHESTVVGIIETMKLMNAVHADVQGVIAEISAENGQFVQKGAVLMYITTGAA